jgi:heme/copper-type cytochrome/quinol oxidase subunit 2
MNLEKKKNLLYRTMMVTVLFLFLFLFLFFFFFFYFHYSYSNPERTSERKDRKRNEWHNKRMTARRALANPIPAAHAAECANERETTATARMIITLS